MNPASVTSAFHTRFGTDCAVFAAPGRINLIGEHTDYNEGFVLPGAIDKDVAVAIRLNGTQTIHAVSLDFQEEIEFSCSDDHVRQHWAKYILGVVRELQATGAQVGGFDCVFGGDVPVGSGMSSSAALESAFAFALDDLLGLNLTRLDLALAGQRAEHNYAGVRCGIMDQFISLHGKKDHFIKLDCRSLEFEYIPFQLDGYSLVLLDTQVKHALASSEYNIRRSQCEAGVEAISKVHPDVTSLRDVTPAMLATCATTLDRVVLRRCAYVIAEHLRLLRACEALKQGDARTVGRMMNGSHDGLRYEYEVSCPELDFLVDLARKRSGVLGARMMGGGFGGCTINLVATEAVDEFIAKVKDEYGKVFAREAVGYVVSIRNGASRLR
jgi:galactokinase